MSLGHRYKTGNESHDKHDEAGHDSDWVLEHNHGTRNSDQEHIVGDLELEPEVGCVCLPLDQLENAECQQGDTHDDSHCEHHGLVAQLRLLISLQTAHQFVASRKGLRLEIFIVAHSTDHLSVDVRYHGEEDAQAVDCEHVEEGEHFRLVFGLWVVLADFLFFAILGEFLVVGGPVEHDRNGEADNNESEAPDKLAIFHEVFRAREDVEEVACVELLVQLVIRPHGDFKHSHEAGDDDLLLKSGPLAVVLGHHRH